MGWDTGHGECKVHAASAEMHSSDTGVGAGRQSVCVRVLVHKVGSTEFVVFALKLRTSIVRISSIWYNQSEE